MPRRVDAGTFEGAPYYRWTKMYRGTRYRVGCAELGAVVWTKEGSCQKANEWWARKRAELDGAAADPVRVAMKEVEAKIGPAALDYALFSPGPAQDEVLRAIAERVSPDPAAVKGHAEYHAARAVNAPAEAGERTVGTLFGVWWDAERARVRGGKVGLSRANMNRLCLERFRDWLGRDTPVEAITEEKWMAWYAYLSGRGWGVSHTDRHFAVSRRFVRLLWELRLIDLPRNLDSTLFQFRQSPEEVEVFTDAEVRRLLSALSPRGQSRLHALLMLNCGMAGMDISELRPEEVDWTAGVVTRKRTKTRGHKNVPVVRYKLWPETFALLRRHKSADPDRALLTTSGKPWIVEWQDAADKYHRSDKVASAMKYWLRRAGVGKAPSSLRATSSSKLAEHPAYKFYAQYFLGQSPRTVADKHYVKPSDDEFFAALAWLREQFLEAK